MLVASDNWAFYEGVASIENDFSECAIRVECIALKG